MKLFAFSLGVLLLAQTPVRPLLNVRMGLWEVTTITDMGGLPGVDTSKLTPQQKAQMEAVMKSAAAKPTVMKSCMTAEHFVTQSPAIDRPGTTCQLNIQTNTAKLLENTMTCTGERPSKAVARTEAQSPTAFMGTVTSTTTTRGREMSVTMTMTGKWLGADCGAIK